MIIKRDKNFSFLGGLFSNSSNLDIYKFIELVKDINYPKLSKDFEEESLKGDYSDLTFRVFNKYSKLSSSQSKKIIDTFSNLENNISTFLKTKVVGTINDWELFATFLELKRDGSISLFFSLESLKNFPNVCEKGSVIDYEVKL